jgi:hypothetical protein
VRINQSDNQKTQLKKFGTWWSTGKGTPLVAILINIHEVFWEGIVTWKNDGSEEVVRESTRNVGFDKSGVVVART